MGPRLGPLDPRHVQEAQVIAMLSTAAMLPHVTQIPRDLLYRLRLQHLLWLHKEFKLIYNKVSVNQKIHRWYYSICTVIVYRRTTISY
jgi:hypothetical protein